MQNDDINHFTLFLLFLKLPKEFWFLKIRDFIPIKTQENWSSASFKVVDLEVQKFEDPQTGDNWGKETNPWEDVTELPLMVATFYPIFFFFFQMLHVPYNFQSPVPAWSIFYIVLSDLRGRSGHRTQLLQILTAFSTGYRILSFFPKF